MINYGTTFFGGKAILKYRMKLTDSQRELLTVQFPDLHIRRSFTGYTIVEGVLTHPQHQDFLNAKKLAMLKSKLAALEVLIANEEIYHWQQDADLS